MFKNTPPNRRRIACLLLPALAVLSACSSDKSLGKAGKANDEILIVSLKPPLPATERDGQGSYRFLMSEGDRRMSVDEFDAWMKANGIRVAKGKRHDSGG